MNDDFGSLVKWMLVGGLIFVVLGWFFKSPLRLLIGIVAFILIGGMMSAIATLQAESDAHVSATLD